MRLTLFQRILALFLALLLWAPQILSSPLNAAQSLRRQEADPFRLKCGTTHFCQYDWERPPDCVDISYGYELCDTLYPKGGGMRTLCRTCVSLNCGATGCTWFGGKEEPW